MGYLTPDRNEMAFVVKGLESASDKIRALFDRGYRQADIARFLETSDQHVSNVVRGPRPKRSEESNMKASAPEQTWLLVDSAGRVVIPAAFRAAMGVEPGGKVLAHMAGGEMHLMTQQHALHKARDLVRRYVPEGEDLVEGLIRERRDEARRESGNG